MTTRTLDTRHFALLDDLVRRMAAHDGPDERTRAAVDVLTAAADPDRADRLAIRAGEPAPLVERLAVWALLRAPEDAVTAAAAVLAGRPAVTTAA